MTEACEDVSSGYYGDKDNSKYRKEARTNLNQSCVHNSHIPFRVQNMLHNEQKSCWYLENSNPLFKGLAPTGMGGLHLTFNLNNAGPLCRIDWLDK